LEEPTQGSDALGAIGALTCHFAGSAVSAKILIVVTRAEHLIFRIIEQRWDWCATGLDRLHVPT
jgi:hypothetical protein